MKAILIDVQKETVSEVEYNGDFQNIYPLIGCDTFTCVYPFPNKDAIFVDDNGLLTLTPESKFFKYKNYPQPLAGNGLVLGTNEDGESIEPETTIETVRKNVKFLTCAQVKMGQY